MAHAPPNLYCCLAKKCRWAEHLASLLKGVAGALLSVSAFNYERAPMLWLEKTQCALEANDWTNSNVKRSHWPLRSLVLMAQTPLNSTMHREHGLACGAHPYPSMHNCWWSITQSFLPQILIALEAVHLKLHECALVITCNYAKLAPRWTLIWVNLQ